MATYWENSCSFGLRYVSWYKYLIVGLVFSHLGFWSGNLFLIAPFPDLCLLVPFQLGIDLCFISLITFAHILPNATLVFAVLFINTHCSGETASRVDECIKQICVWCGFEPRAGNM